MGVYDIATDCKPHPHPGCLARVQRLEDVIDTFRRNPLTPVRHTDLHLMVIQLADSDRDQFFAPLACRNTMQGILQQVDEHQLNLQGVGEVAGAAARRWFRNTPTDRAPEPTALAPEREPLALPKPEQFREEAQSIRLEADGRAYTDLLAEQSPLSGIRVAAPRIATGCASAAASVT